MLYLSVFIVIACTHKYIARRYKYAKVSKAGTETVQTKALHGFLSIEFQKKKKKKEMYNIMLDSSFGTISLSCLPCIPPRADMQA